MPHPIFQIDEILRLIVEWTCQVSKPAAVEFACCCKAFEEPVLRALWKEISFTSLTHLLPKDVLQSGPPSEHEVGFISSCHYSPN